MVDIIFSEMAISLRGIGVFCSEIYNLYSFPLVSAYLLIVCFSGIWQKYTKPLSLRQVSESSLCYALA